MLGIDPRAEADTSGLRDWLRSDEIPAELRVADVDRPLGDDADATPGVLIGLERMQREGLRPGDRVVLTTANLVTDERGAKRPEKVTVELVVAGAFRTDHGGFDGNSVFVALTTLQRAMFADTPQFVQEVAVRVKRTDRLQATADRLQRTVHRVVERDQRGFGVVQTWRQKNKQFLDSVAHQRGLMKIALIVIMVVAAFLMLATLSMMVTEKTSDIGILTAMGGTPGGVTLVFLACGLVITAAGVVLGLSLGILTSVYLEEIRQAVLWAFGVDLFPLDVYNLTRVPCRIEPFWLLQVTLMALATGFVVSSIPALRAARHDPLVSLRGV